MLPEGIHRDIEVVTDMWGRPKVRLAGAIAEHLKDVTIHLSMTHEADTAAAVAVLESQRLASSREQTRNCPFRQDVSASLRAPAARMQMVSG